MTESAATNCGGGSPDSSRSLLEQALSSAETATRLERRNRLPRYRPYPKQREFHDAGAVHRELATRLFGHLCPARGWTDGRDGRRRFEPR